ncbi:MAG TPA: hypothetical protein VL522_03705, partial [Bordetella sp.]|nr:hypothetical protein [Bordetella sp.]
NSLDTLFDPAPEAFFPQAGASMTTNTNTTSIAADAFANYLPAPASCRSRGRPSMAQVLEPTVQAAARPPRRTAEFGSACATFSPGARKTALRTMPDYLDGTAILRGIVRQWREKGISRATIDAVRNGVPLEPRAEDGPGIIALGQALKKSGDYERLTTQAINVYRTTCAWKETLASLAGKHPRPVWREIEQGLMDEKFHLHDSDYRHNAAVLNLLLHPERLIDLDSGTAADPR